MMGDYPEHEKMAAIAEQSQAIGEFLDTGGYTLCEFRTIEGFRDPSWGAVGWLPEVLEAVSLSVSRSLCLARATGS